VWAVQLYADSCAAATRAAAAAGPALTIEERIEERLAFKLNFYRVRRQPVPAIHQHHSVPPVLCQVLTAEPHREFACSGPSCCCGVSVSNLLLCLLWRLSVAGAGVAGQALGVGGQGGCGRRVSFVSSFCWSGFASQFMAGRRSGMLQLARHRLPVCMRDSQLSVLSACCTACRDLNISPQPIDSCKPGPVAEFLRRPDRQWLSQLLADTQLGLTDCFRHFHPDRCVLCWAGHWLIGVATL
jgi:hypothetical protein